MQTRYALGVFNASGNGGNGNRRGIAGQQRRRGADLRQLAEQRLFDLQTLGRRFNHQLRLRKLIQFSCRRNTRQQHLCLLGADFPATDAGIQTLGNTVDGASNRVGGNVIQQHRMPGAGSDFNNARAHGAAANHGDGVECLRHGLFPAELWRTFAEEGADALAIVVAAPGKALEIALNVKLVIQGVGFRQLQRFLDEP